MGGQKYVYSSEYVKQALSLYYYFLIIVFICIKTINVHCPHLYININCDYPNFNEYAFIGHACIISHIYFLL